ncbi:hypothetical protein N7G274_000819 [Stereocaulon virgatum]|uniref:GH16 domain-containing protein n=1 Tax=Stereocaulon virgatum TaxID=373712 RepID=A0ABR4APV5_9LECA
MSSSDTSPPGARGLTPPVHVRLNSSNSNLLTNEANSNQPLAPSRQRSSRSLVPQQKSTPASSTTAASERGNNPLNRIYNGGPMDSSETLLIPPTRSRTHRFRDEESVPGSPVDGFSRRTSFSSDGKGRDSRIYGLDPFADSRTPSRAGSDDENVNTQTVSEKYNILPSAGLLLFPEDVEKDDWLHNPDPNEKESRECNVFTKRGFANVGGLTLVVIGLLVLFIGYPILTFVQRFTKSTQDCASDPNCLDVGKIPLFKNIRTSLIDPDTPKSAMTKKAPDGSTLNLVFSDEFNTDGRTFYPGDDPFFTAVDLWYGVTQDLEWYDPDAVTTNGGVLELKFDAFQSHGLNYRSGMVQSWNQLCFTGGMLEASISLPGRGDTVGFWPGFWSMGNLGRPGYAATTDGMWPYSYSDTCDAGITANQSQTDGTSYLPGMRLPACTCSGEDHPTPGKSRSAPEIDVIEASVVPLGQGATNMIGAVSQSCQLAPFDIWYQPDTNFIEVYDDSISVLNSYQGAPFQQALSGLTNINNNWYNAKDYATYSFYYQPGPKGQITWSVADVPAWKLDARAIGPNGNVGQRVIPTEPMALVMNFGMSTGFSAINTAGILATLPATMRFDYVRIYQRPGSTSMTCDPAGYETTEYIKNHMDAYTNPNKTQWHQTSHSWPKNTLVNNCKS